MELSILERCLSCVAPRCLYLRRAHMMRRCAAAADDVTRTSVHYVLSALSESLFKPPHTRPNCCSLSGDSWRRVPSHILNQVCPFLLPPLSFTSRLLFVTNRLHIFLYYTRLIFCLNPWLSAGIQLWFLISTTRKCCIYWGLLEGSGRSLPSPFSSSPVLLHWR